MKRCPICGGATTCPAGLYEEVLPARPYLTTAKEPKEGHRAFPQGLGPRYYYLLPERVVVEGKEYELEVVGTAQMGRIKAHYGVEGTWVKMTTYAFYVVHRS